MLVSDELNKRGRGRNPKYTARAQPVRHPRRGWHGLGPDAGTWRSSQVFSLAKAVDKVRALPELRQQDAAQFIGRFCRARLRCWAHARQDKKVCPPPELAVRCR